MTTIVDTIIDRIKNSGEIGVTPHQIRKTFYPEETIESLNKHFQQAVQTLEGQGVELACRVLLLLRSGNNSNSNNTSSSSLSSNFRSFPSMKSAEMYIQKLKTQQQQDDASIGEVDAQKHLMIQRVSLLANSIQESAAAEDGARVQATSTSSTMMKLISREFTALTLTPASSDVQEGMLARKNCQGNYPLMTRADLIKTGGVGVSLASSASSSFNYPKSTSTSAVASPLMPNVTTATTSFASAFMKEEPKQQQQQTRTTSDEALSLQPKKVARTEEEVQDEQEKPASPTTSNNAAAGNNARGVEVVTVTDSSSSSLDQTTASASQKDDSVIAPKAPVQPSVASFFKPKPKTTTATATTTTAVAVEKKEKEATSVAVVVPVPTSEDAAPVNHVVEQQKNVQQQPGEEQQQEQTPAEDADFT